MASPELAETPEYCSNETPRHETAGDCTEVLGTLTLPQLSLLSKMKTTFGILGPQAPSFSLKKHPDVAGWVAMGVGKVSTPCHPHQGDSLRRSLKGKKGFLMPKQRQGLPGDPGGRSATTGKSKVGGEVHKEPFGFNTKEPTSQVLSSLENWPNTLLYKKWGKSIPNLQKSC